MIKTNHDAASVCRIAIYQKVVIGFLLLYLVAIVCSFTLPDDLRPMVGYLLLPAALIAAVFLFLLAFQVFGVRIGLALLAVELVVLGICLSGGSTPASGAPARPTEPDKNEIEEVYKELKRHLATLKVDPPPDTDPGIGDPPTAEDRQVFEKALALRAKVKQQQIQETATDSDEEPQLQSGPGLIWVLLATLVILIVVNARAAFILRKHGVSMGLLGPHLPDLLGKAPKTGEPGALATGGSAPFTEGSSSR